MQFPVPQFVDVEDTIVGPLTVKQTVIIGAGVLVIFISIMLFVTIVAVIIAIPVIVICLIFAFYKPNGRPAYTFAFNYFTFAFKPKLYIWKREPEGLLIKRSIRKETLRDSGDAELKIVSRNRLQELAWILDTQQAIMPEGDGGQREII
jgi:hypothetical protein